MSLAEKTVTETPKYGFARPSDVITMGQGEYVVFQERPNDEKGQLSREQFHRIYEILLNHSPFALTQSESEKCAHRFEEIQTKLRDVDPSLRAVFIPRTLYELFFIRKCIKEDLRAKKVCSLLDPNIHLISETDVKLKEYKESVIKEKKCWHLCIFFHQGDSRHEGVQEIAYRLNQAIVKRLNSSTGRLTFQDISTLDEKEIDFLKNYYTSCQEITKKIQRGLPCDGNISNCSTPGPAGNFGYESSRGKFRPMGIRNEEDAQIIRQALALECSQVAQRCLFLYRGTDEQTMDAPVDGEGKKPFSLSYGTSLFAGCVFDGGATAFHFMTRQDAAYAVSVPFDQATKSPFFIPETHTVAQLLGAGEFFHSRTKAWKDFDVARIGGININPFPFNGRESLKSPLSKEELEKQFQEYKAAAFVFKREGKPAE